jgi:hypothetical protein
MHDRPQFITFPDMSGSPIILRASEILGAHRLEASADRPERTVVSVRGGGAHTTPLPVSAFVPLLAPIVLG